MKFNEWIETFIKEKQIDKDDLFVLHKDGVDHIFEYGYIIEVMKQTTPKEKVDLKESLVMLDFLNGDIKDYIKFLANALIWL